MRSAAFVTLALAMLSFSVTGCQTIRSCNSGACGANGCTSCGNVLGGCSSCGQANCGCGLGHGGRVGHGGLLGRGGLIGGGGLVGHGMAAQAVACPRCGQRGLLGALCKGCGTHLRGNGGAGGGTPYTEPYAGPYGPMSPTVGNPYYTTRAPRDFLVNNPPTIGR